MAEFVSITEAARRLTAAGDAIERSTLSRYLRQHAEALPLQAAGKERLVDFEALAAHRAENIRIAPTGALVLSSSSPPPSRAPRFPGSQSDGAARKAQADAELREMDLAERRKTLTPVAEVDRAGRDAIALMQSAFERALETDSASASLKYGWDERTVRLVLKSFVARGLDVFHRDILNALDAMRRSPDDPPAGQTDHGGP